MPFGEEGEGDNEEGSWGVANALLLIELGGSYKGVLIV